MSRMMIKLLTLVSLLAVSLSACAPLAPTAQPSPSTNNPAETPADAGTANEQPAQVGFVLFDRAQGAFITYAMDGSPMLTSQAPGITYASPWNTSIVRDAVYFQADENKKIYRSSAQGVEGTLLPTQNVTDFSVSPDEKLAAWSTLDPQTGLAAFWIGNLDGSGAKQITTAAPTTPVEGMWFTFIDWTPDGKLLFDRLPTGIGGYIPYAGHVNLFSYDPATGQIEEIAKSPEQRMCLETYRQDLRKLVFNCNETGPIITIRDLAGEKETVLDKLPGQGLAGSARFSPSGAWLAYATAAGDSSNESGDVVVVPADLGAAPKSIARVDGNSFPYVVGWLNEDTILFTRNHEESTTLWTVQPDGSGLQQIAEGSWVGWVP